MFAFFCTVNRVFAVAIYILNDGPPCWPLAEHWKSVLLCIWWDDFSGICLSVTVWRDIFVLCFALGLFVVQ